MVRVQDLTRISDHEWEIPRTFRPDMRVAVRIYATRILLEHIARDKSLEQDVNTATLPGLVGHLVVMPDMHQGYGFPIGAVAATGFPDGVISPGGIGYDINCGVRLLACSLQAETAAPYLDTLATLLNKYCPSGVGQVGVVSLNLSELERLMREGSHWAARNGYATRSDLAERRTAVAWKEPTRSESASAPRPAGASRSAHSAQGTTSSRLIGLKKYSTLKLQLFSACKKAVWLYRSIAARAASVIRSAPTTFRSSSLSCAVTALICLTGNWSVRQWTPRKDRLISVQCAQPPILPLSTGNCWPTQPSAPLRRRSPGR